MTCIVAVRDKKKKIIYMGGDSCAGNSDYYTADIISNPKVFSKGEFLFGYTTSFRMGQIIEKCFVPPPITSPTKDVYDYMIKKFIPKLQKALKDCSWGRIKDGRAYGGEFIVGIRGHLFGIYSDYCVLEYKDDFLVCGCGEPYAKGSLYSDTRNKGAVERALKVASHFSVYVSGPFHILSKKYK